MIASFQYLRSHNDGGTRSVSVFATEDAAGGSETVTFTILDQTRTVQVDFAPRQSQLLKVDHTASGRGLVTVSASNSPRRLEAMLDLDLPGDEDWPYPGT